MFPRIGALVPYLNITFRQGHLFEGALIQKLIKTNNMTYICLLSMLNTHTHTHIYVYIYNIPYRHTHIHTHTHMAIFSHHGHIAKNMKSVIF